MEEDFLALISCNITEEEMFYLKLKNIDDKLIDFTYWLKSIKETYPSTIINPYDLPGKKVHNVIDGEIKGIDYSTATDTYITSIDRGNFEIVYFGIGSNNLYDFQMLMKRSMFFEDLKDALGFVNDRK